VVEGVEGIYTELTLDALVDGNVLVQREIIGPEGWTKIVVATYIAKLGDVGMNEYSRLRSVGSEGSYGNEIGA
jgi:hypothetical protein